MSHPLVVHIDSKQAVGSIYIGRRGGNILGNPYFVDQYGREKCIQLYEIYARKRIAEGDCVFITAIYNLFGKVQSCHCAPQRCHGEVNVVLSNEMHARRLMANPQDKIVGFNKEYRFLSNFWPCKVYIRLAESDEKVSCKTVEHAYQALKSDNELEQRKVLAADTPGQARQLGRGVTLKLGWSDKRLDYMRALTRQKYADPSLCAMLLATGYAELIEDNWWGDEFWGVCRGVGESWLGRILMEERDARRAESTKNTLPR